MNKLSKSTILLFTLLVISLSGNSQITVTKIEKKNVSATNDGFVYSLPKTVFKIDIVYEKIEEIAGPLADYTTEYLGVNNYISSSKTEYFVKNVDVSSYNF